MAPPHTVTQPYSDFTKTTYHDTYPYINPVNSTHKDHTVFITGASKGIGRNIALSFALSGCPRIIIGARTIPPLSALQSELLSAASKAGHTAPKIIKLAIDVSNKDSVKQAVQEVEKELCESGVDILVNNAGIADDFNTTMKEVDEDVWWRTWEVNVKGVFLVTKALLQLLLKSKEKTVVNLSSIGAHQLSPGASAYQTGKLALMRLSEFMVVDNEGLIAYSVHPGGVLTAMGQQLPAAFHQYLIDTPALAGDTIAFLTRQRREWLSGRYIDCRWDIEELLARKQEIEEGDKLKTRMVV